MSSPRSQGLLQRSQNEQPTGRGRFSLVRAGGLGKLPFCRSAPTYKQVQVVGDLDIQEVTINATVSEKSQTNSIRKCLLCVARRGCEGLPGKIRLLLGELWGSPTVCVPLTSFPFSLGHVWIQTRDKRSWASVVIVKSGCDCPRILAQITFWLCDFCVKCSQKQSIVKVVIKETWERGLDLPREWENGKRVLEGRRKE